jgi:hypothetical protein
MCALAGRIVTKEEYMEQIKAVNAKAAEIYRYMNFDQIPSFVFLSQNGFTIYARYAIHPSLVCFDWAAIENAMLHDNVANRLH